MAKKEDELKLTDMSIKELIDVDDVCIKIMTYMDMYLRSYDNSVTNTKSEDYSKYISVIDKRKKIIDEMYERIKNL